MANEDINQFPNKKSTSNKKIISYLTAGALLIALVSSILVGSEQNKTISNASYDSKYESPIVVQKEYTVLTKDLKSGKSNVFVLPSGSKITVPGNSLVDETGKSIEGKVTFKFREFLDQKDVFLSGIPMTYDSSGSQYNFVSAGMFELLAYQNNSPVFIEQGKSIHVELASKQTGNNYNSYYYSAKNKQWEYKGKDAAGFDKSLIIETEKAIEQTKEFKALIDLQREKMKNEITLEKLKNAIPISPKAVSPNSHHFTINVDYKDFPELTVLEGLMFQVSPKERNFKPEYADEQWQDVNVLPGNKNSEYLTCFSNKKLGKLCFLTNPVYAIKHLKNAEKNFEVLMAKYEAKKVAIEDKNKIISAQIATRIIKLNENKIVALNRRSANQSVQVENQITRNFQIEKFGIWNSDYPRKQPAEAVVQGNFMNGKSGGEIKLRTIYLVLKSENQVISMPVHQAKRGIRFKPSEEYMLWGVTADGKNVAVFSVPQFKSILKSTENYRFNMKLIDSKVFAKYTTENIFEL